MRGKWIGILAALFAGALLLAGCAGSTENSSTAVTSEEEKANIEKTLNLANNENQEWAYDTEADAWVLSIVTAVTNPENADEQGVSVCVPGVYVKGIDTDKDGKADTTAKTYQSAVKGSLVIDGEATINSSNGQKYTASTAPVILNTGAEGYSAQENQLAQTTYAKEGYINVACGNRGKQNSTTDGAGNTVYYGDAPSCLVDQKAAARYVKYNILLGNLPGSVDHFVSTGGSGGGAHATMFAATSNNQDYYNYQIEAGAVGVYRTEDGYSTTVTIDGKDYDLSDGAWGCVAYSAISSLEEADMAMAFEYYMDTDYNFNTSFQKQLAQYLSQEYMDYINSQKLSVKEAEVGFDLNNDGDKEDTIQLTIEYDASKYKDTNGYGGTYLDLYLAEFQSNLQKYLDDLDYAEGWTWFDEDGKALSDKAVSKMSSEDKTKAFIEGRYTKSEADSNQMKGPMGQQGGLQGKPDGQPPTGALQGGQNGGRAGTPDAGTTQASGSSKDSGNYSSYSDMLQEYQSDIQEIESGDKYGNNIVSLYNPLNYIGAEGTEAPAWTRIVMGASEGDMSMFNSLNLQIAWLNAGTDAEIEWQWDGGHVPNEIFGDSLSLYVDQMYAKYVEGAATVEKEAASKTTSNGTATEATGTDISNWVNYGDLSNVSFTLADAVSYRTAGANKSTPGFDTIDYGQEDYVFGSSTKDARHWNKYVLKVLKEHQGDLEKLFNKG